MSLRGRIFAAAYDRLSEGSEQAGLGAFRRVLLAGASGRVLEIGGGTGANLRYYGPGIEVLTITEPEAPMLKRLERRVRDEARQATVLRAPAEDLPFEDGSFDTAVSTLVLCGVSDQQRALQELRRVLRSGGRLLFIEHVRADDPGLARFQDRMNPINRFVAGCDCNRSTLDAIEAGGFAVTQLARTSMPRAPKFVRPLLVGEARAG
jgi:ubiquinone/menaquinone biosynthesis C-methylase UbiE